MGFDSQKHVLNTDVLSVKFDEVIYGFKSVPNLNSFILISKTEAVVQNLGSNETTVSLNEEASLPFNEVETEIL